MAASTRSSRTPRASICVRTMRSRSAAKSRADPLPGTMAAITPRAARMRGLTRPRASRATRADLLVQLHRGVHLHAERAATRLEGRRHHGFGGLHSHRGALHEGHRHARLTDREADQVPATAPEPARDQACALAERIERIHDELVLDALARLGDHAEGDAS